MLKRMMVRAFFATVGWLLIIIKSFLFDVWQSQLDESYIRPYNIVMRTVFQMHLKAIKSGYWPDEDELRQKVFELGKENNETET